MAAILLFIIGIVIFAFGISIVAGVTSGIIHHCSCRFTHHYDSRHGGMAARS